MINTDKQAFLTLQGLIDDIKYHISSSKTDKDFPKGHLIVAQAKIKDAEEIIKNLENDVYKEMKIDTT